MSSLATTDLSERSAYHIIGAYMASLVKDVATEEFLTLFFETLHGPPLTFDIGSALRTRLRDILLIQQLSILKGAKTDFFPEFELPFLTLPEPAKAEETPLWSLAKALTTQVFPGVSALERLLVRLSVNPLGSGRRNRSLEVVRRLLIWPQGLCHVRGHLSRAQLARLLEVDRGTFAGSLADLFDVEVDDERLANILELGYQILRADRSTITEQHQRFRGLLRASPLIGEGPDGLPHRLFRLAMFRVAWAGALTRWDLHVRDETGPMVPIGEPTSLFGQGVAHERRSRSDPSEVRELLGRLRLADWQNWSVDAFRRNGRYGLSDRLERFARVDWPGHTRKHDVALQFLQSRDDFEDLVTDIMVHLNPQS